MLTLPTYVLITPARNEAQFIEGTIESVVAQTVRPLKWIVVSDGSTDGTDEIVARYANEYPWIELLCMPKRGERHFAGKVGAFNAAYARLGKLNYDVIASLDGDITFDKDYFSFLLRKLAEDPALGLVGTPFKDWNGTYNYRFTNIEHVSGACQVFRRECFEEIGGYVPIKGGGIDLVAVLKARMEGWKTRTFIEKVSLHHRKIGTAQHSALLASYQYGVKDYVLGSHPVWEFFRICYQMVRRPYFFGGLLMGCGFAWSMIRGAERTIPNEVMAFRRREEMRRLQKFITSVAFRDAKQS